MALDNCAILVAVIDRGYNACGVHCVRGALLRAGSVSDGWVEGSVADASGSYVNAHSRSLMQTALLPQGPSCQPTQTRQRTTLSPTRRPTSLPCTPRWTTAPCRTPVRCAPTTKTA